MKTNFESLEEAIANLGDTQKWIDAIKEEMEDLEERIDELERKNSELEEKVEELEENQTDGNILKIDCGIGFIEYIEPDNLKLQSLMEDFKRIQERKAGIHA